MTHFHDQINELSKIDPYKIKDFSKRNLYFSLSLYIAPYTRRLEEIPIINFTNLPQSLIIF